MYYKRRAPLFCRRSVLRPAAPVHCVSSRRNVVPTSASPVNTYYYCTYIYIYMYMYNITYIHTHMRACVCVQCLYFLSPIPVSFPLRRCKTSSLPGSFTPYYISRSPIILYHCQQLPIQLTDTTPSTIIHNNTSHCCTSTH